MDILESWRVAVETREGQPVSQGGQISGGCGCVVRRGPLDPRGASQSADGAITFGLRGLPPFHIRTRSKGPAPNCAAVSRTDCFSPSPEFRVRIRNDPRTMGGYHLVGVLQPRDSLASTAVDPFAGTIFVSLVGNSQRIEFGFPRKACLIRNNWNQVLKSNPAAACSWCQRDVSFALET